jgi:sporulation protein YlmC with PRC-barrel domain
MPTRSAIVKIFLPLAASLLWAAPIVAQTTHVSLPLKAQQLMGMKVEDIDGQKIGTIRNLVLDTRTGQLKYAVIGSGGFLGVRATLRLAPAEVMSAATAKRQTLAINATAAQWSHAPVFKWSHLASLAEPTRAREISRYFEPTAARASRAGTLSTTGRWAAEETNALEPVLKFVSDLIGMNVVNQNQEKIGEVLDLLVSFGKPRQAFALVSTGRLFHRGHQFAVPLKALSASDNGRALKIEVDTAALQQASPFNSQVWDARGTNGSGQVYRYSKGDE